ncbi:hypothetical protein F7725_018573 [Dissostichus mawsoni]|uniref:Juxtaposed with another zinc finger protein 1 n=1 Tax=Dissostichus mawsoni TaxID=36200 RepID=A0A7J5XRU5_DISMA|nr:hypothetical protein F7725_018573 [Dissostichus mawsoni]
MLSPRCSAAAAAAPPISNAAATMTGIAAASFFSNVCRFGGCGLHFDSLAELIVHIEDNHIVTRKGSLHMELDSVSFPPQRSHRNELPVPPLLVMSPAAHSRHKHVTIMLTTLLYPRVHLAMRGSSSPLEAPSSLSLTAGGPKRIAESAGKPAPACLPRPSPHLRYTDPRLLEKQEQQQPTYVALSYINRFPTLTGPLSHNGRFMTDAARREHETLKKKVQPKLSLSLTGSLSRSSVSTPPRHTSGNLTPPVTPPITPSSSFRSSTPTGSECDEEDVDFEESDSDESWTTESAISSESILSSMCMNGGDEKPFACPVPGCKKRYKNVNGIKYHAKNGHRTQIRVRKPFKCRCGKSYKTSQGLRHHTINFHPPISTDIIRKMQQ